MRSDDGPARRHDGSTTLHLLWWSTCGGIHFIAVQILMFVVHIILQFPRSTLKDSSPAVSESYLCSVRLRRNCGRGTWCGKSLCGTLSVADLCGRVCQILPHCGDPAAAQLGGGEVPVCNQHLRQHHHGHVLPRYLVPERLQSCPS